MGFFVFLDLYAMIVSINNSNPFSSAVISSCWRLNASLKFNDKKSSKADLINRSHDITVLTFIKSAISSRLFSSSSILSRALVKLVLLLSRIHTARTMNFSVNCRKGTSSMGSREKVTWSHFLSPLSVHKKRRTGKSDTENPVSGQVALRV